MSEIRITTTGSFPKAYLQTRAVSEAEIQQVVSVQVEADIDVLVYGQLEADIVGIFARDIGLEGDGLPYVVTGKIKPPAQSVVLPHLRIAARYAEGRPLKAHITGASVIAENCVFNDDTPGEYRGESGFYNLALDIAAALAQEARWIARESKALNIQYLQIDEPSLVFGGDTKAVRDGTELIVNAWKEAGGGQTIMHVCWDFTGLFRELLKMPVDILNLVAEHFHDLSPEDFQALQESGKQIALGVIPVNTDHLPTPERIAREALFARAQISQPLFWGLTPVCGLRESSPEHAQAILTRLSEAREILVTNFLQKGVR